MQIFARRLAKGVMISLLAPVLQWDSQYRGVTLHAERSGQTIYKKTLIHP